MSILYNAFKSAAKNETPFNQREMFQAEISDTFYELEENLIRFLSPHEFVAEFDITRTKNATLFSINILPNAADGLLKNIAMKFNKKSDQNKVFKAYYETAGIATPTLTILAPHKKGACQVLTAKLPVNAADDLRKLKHVTGIKHGDYNKLSNVLGEWLQENFGAHLDNLHATFTDRVQDDQAKLQASAAPTGYQAQIRSARQFVQKK